ncbi:amidohydrolase family protein [Microbacterium sp. HD4P20]|uniref:amidohydrolase family protein n=1 Tax=Microbacterium sp. HD4P20 TaxID=2864874 RepID=UPI001C63B9BA|nr:amidohydrolase family protein [Microbacterium sp. HD4P20]MCP2636175.1 amidohydrolase family protein [Microbacterium sp. HD4P20]
MRILDSHLHLWDPAVLTYGWLEGPLRRRFGPDELHAALGEMPEQRERAFIFVQAECLPEQTVAEVDWVSSLAVQAAVRGIVARAPLEQGAEAGDLLEELRANPLVVGIRRNLQDEPRSFARRDGFVEGAGCVARLGLVFDACVRPEQLVDVAALADALPELIIVLDHLGKPPVGSAERPAYPDATTWETDIRELAARPNVSCKLSGLPAESSGEWSADQLVPFLDTALEAFGPDRVMFGSDWPVSVRADYPRWSGAVMSWLSTRTTPEEADAVLWRNAERVYRLV